MDWCDPLKHRERQHIAVIHWDIDSWDVCEVEQCPMCELWEMCEHWAIKMWKVLIKLKRVGELSTLMFIIKVTFLFQERPSDSRAPGFIQRGLLALARSGTGLLSAASWHPKHLNTWICWSWGLWGLSWGKSRVIRNIGLSHQRLLPWHQHNHKVSFNEF